jgi:hypothetical protein
LKTMKIILLVIAGAFAAQDTTPPVISLSFYGHTDNTNFDVPLGICKDLDANDATDCAAKTATECGAATTECEWRFTGKCRTHKKWSAALGESSTFDDAFNTCKDHGTDKSSCESDTTNACHWVSLGDDVPKWYFETSHDSVHDGHAQTSKRASVTCVVGSTSVTCPDPKCTKTDHHDGTGECDNPHVVLVRGGNNRHTASQLFNAGLGTMNAAQARTGYDGGVGEGVSYNSNQPGTDELTGAVTTTCTVSKSSTSPHTCVNRADLGD